MAQRRWSVAWLAAAWAVVAAGCSSARSSDDSAAPAAAAPDPARALSLYTQGRIAWELGDPSRALELWDAAAALQPGTAPIEVARAQARFAMGDDAGAALAVDAALAAAPLEPAANVLRARLDVRLHDLGGALRRLLELEASGCVAPELFQLLHPLLLYGGDAARGLALFERARERLPAHAFVHEACADFLACLRREEEALASYRRALALDPTRLSAEIKAARLLEEQGDRILRRLAAPVGAGVGLPATQDAPRAGG